MTDQLMNQQRYEREIQKRNGYSNLQCALFVVGVLAFFHSIIYWVG
jgi:hypothetical protein